MCITPFRNEDTMHLDIFYVALGESLAWDQFNDHITTRDCWFNVTSVCATPAFFESKISLQTAGHVCEVALSLVSAL